MKLFPYGHATHPQWQMAAELWSGAVRAQMALPATPAAPTLALLYITDHYALQAQEILDHLSAELPEITDWAGTVGVGIAANNAEYFDEPALAVMLCELPTDQYRVFSGVAPLGLGFEAHTALIHADASTPDLGELIEEMALRTDSGYLFGGLASQPLQAVQFAVGGDGNISGQGAASGVFSGGLSGVAFGAGVNLVSRVTQGCLPVARAHQVTAADRHVVLELDGEPALDVLLGDLPFRWTQPQEALEAVRATLVGLVARADARQAWRGRCSPRSPTGQFWQRCAGAPHHWTGPGAPWRCRGRAGGAGHATGVLPAQCAGGAGRSDPHLRRNSRGTGARGAAAGGGHRAACVRGRSGAASGARHCRRHLRELCRAGRAALWGPSAELQIVRRALGDVPLVGFFAGGEIAHHHLYGYTGVLTVFTGN